VPAAAVIPAPIAYIKVVAVKTLVVEDGCGGAWRRELVGAFVAFRGVKAAWVTLKKLECSKQARAWIH
jgi:hypothetical protein